MLRNYPQNRRGRLREKFRRAGLQSAAKIDLRLRVADDDAAIGVFEIRRDDFGKHDFRKRVDFRAVRRVVFIIFRPRGDNVGFFGYLRGVVLCRRPLFGGNVTRKRRAAGQTREIVIRSRRGEKIFGDERYRYAVFAYPARSRARSKPVSRRVDGIIFAFRLLIDNAFLRQQRKCAGRVG